MPLHPYNGDEHSLPGNSVYSIYKDHLENIWVGTNNGLGLFNPKQSNSTYSATTILIRIHSLPTISIA